MVDITEISAMVAATGVLVGVVYYILDLRHQTKIRKTDLVISLMSDYNGREKQQAFVDVTMAKFKDYGDFVEKYGMPFSSRNEVPMSFMMMGNFFEQIGVLFRKKLIDASLISDLFPFTLWEKMKPILEGTRKEYHEPKYYEWFEYLYNEMTKREQKLQQSKA